MEETNWLADLVAPEPDIRGPLMLSEAVEENPAGEFLEKMQMDQLHKNAGKVPAHVVVPTIDEILGIRTDQDIIVKSEPVEHIEDPAMMTLIKSAKRASRPGQVRLEKTILDNEVWLTGYDHEGVEVFSRPFEETE